MVREEIAILALLAVAFGAVALARGGESLESLLWLAVLAVQAVPYLAAVTLSLISSRAPRRRRGRLSPLETERAVARETL